MESEEGGDYYFINVDLAVKSMSDTYSTDNKLWDTLNYFRMTEEAVKRMKSFAQMPRGDRR